GQLGVISNDAAGPTTINLSGVGIAPVVTLSAPLLTFASQVVSSTSTAQPVTVNNIGDAPLTVTTIATSGDFAQTNDCGVSVAINASCTISVTFTPTLRGTRNGAVTMVDNAAGTPHVVTLQGTGIGPATTLGRTTVTFAGQFTGTTSVAQSVTLTSSGETALNIASITVSGDFAQTNNCGTSLPATQSCTIQVTFAPTALGPRGGSITIVDNSTSTPEVVTLIGTGTTFTIGTQAGGSSSATVNAGGTATYNLTVLGTPGATGNVTFACSGAPAASTCTVTPASAALNGGIPVNFAVAVTTTSRASLAPFSFRLPFSGTPFYWPLLAWMALALLLVMSFRITKLPSRAVLASAVLGIVMLMAACGGSGSTPPPPTPTPTPSPTPGGPGTPAGTSILAVTATSGGATRTFNLTLTVN
ncbi:MAG TPA: choice-of-anchor D domain-containing protein, partial [Candidatus Angelobacter sp.]|nr:choice-of-anchor D domain-containing protein [Candidatus Angelobacter sp.]